MQNEKANMRRRRGLRDYPELQVGYPERNDVSNPNHEMERIHVDLETLDISKKSASRSANQCSDSVAIVVKIK